MLRMNQLVLNDKELRSGTYEVYGKTEGPEIILIVRFEDELRHETSVDVLADQGERSNLVFEVGRVELNHRRRRSIQCMRETERGQS